MTGYKRKVEMWVVKVKRIPYNVNIWCGKSVGGEKDSEIAKGKKS